MIDLSSIKKELLAFAADTPTEEVCGLIAVHPIKSSDDDKVKLVVYPCKNVADDKANSYVISPEDYAHSENSTIAAGGKIIGYYHSHINSDDTSPSDSDLEMARRSDLAGFLITNGEIVAIKPYKHSELLNRKFIYGVSDCYTLTQDYFRKVGIHIADYQYVVGDEPKMTRLGAEESGFVEIDKKERLRIHDLFLISYVQKRGDHLAIYVDNGIILHHLPRHLSCRDYLQRWQKRIVLRWRHKSLL